MRKIVSYSIVEIHDDIESVIYGKMRAKTPNIYTVSLVGVVPASARKLHGEGCGPLPGPRLHYCGEDKMQRWD
jgi:hypothetical protein